jgi:anti-anti-sigma regulatory factor
MLKIVVERGGTTGAVRVEGRVIGPWVGELARACDQLLGSGSELVIDLAAVSFVDRAGVALLRRLAARGAAVVNASRFVAEQLKG